MVRLRKISSALAAAFCLLSFSGIYLVNAACSTGDIMSSIVETHEGEHQHHNVTGTETQHEHHHSGEEDGKCCSGVAFTFFYSVHALSPLIELQEVALSVITPVFFSQSTLLSFCKSPNILVISINGPPSCLSFGALIRVFIQSFQI